MKRPLSALRHVVWRSLRLSSLGPTLSARLKIAAVAAILPLLELVGARSPRPMTIRISRFGGEAECALSHTSELEVLRQVFLGELYRLPAGFEPRVIFDLGSNIGVSIIYFRLRYPQAEIFGFEPDPASQTKLERNTRGLEHVTVQAVGVSDPSGELTFYTSEETWSSSLYRQRSFQREVAVRCERLDTLVEAAGVEAIDLLKVTIEGAELAVLPGFSGLADVQAIAGHAHPGRRGRPVEELAEALAAFRLQMSGPPDDLRFKAFNDRIFPARPISKSQKQRA